MKKILVMFTMCLMMAVMTSCGSSHENTPRGLAEAAVKCLADKDYKGYMNLTNATDQQKQAMAQMLEKVGQQADQKGGMKSYEITNEEIDESGDKANVTVKILYEDGSEENNTMKMLKKDGDWVLSADK